MRILKPPSPTNLARTDRVVFLAGSIEMGVAEDWQARIAIALSDVDAVALNPRRDEWDASWRQSIDEPKFREQVEWELAGLERADVIAMWFAPDTKSPITLLELGLHARGGRVIVGCPHGFWRRGNLEVVCARYGVPLVAAWEPFVATVRGKVAP
ncbi:MAG: nucleoside 2-deoxyribosyltransferase domain-containing protein [Kofleriaceae bacterium]